MLPQTHRFIIDQAIMHCGSWAHEYREEIFRGNDDEDVHIIPLVGWRLRAAGFTHTHVPRGRFGELGFSSAKLQALRFLAKARRSLENPKQCAWWTGRACHLLGDTAVPARAHRIWHLEGDPFEGWLEQHCHEFEPITLQAEKIPLEPTEIFEQMAELATTLPADTTRTPWGRAAWEWFHSGKRLDESEFARQSRILIPEVIRLTRSLISWVELH